MKKLSVVFASVFLMFTGTLLANDVPGKGTKNLSAQIHELLEDNQLKIQGNEQLTAQVRFTLNNEGEIVVLSVETQDSILEGFVKNRLNYKKVEVAKIEEGKLYTVPVKFTA